MISALGAILWHDKNPVKPLISPIGASLLINRITKVERIEGRMTKVEISASPIYLILIIQTHLRGDIME